MIEAKTNKAKIGRTNLKHKPTKLVKVPKSEATYLVESHLFRLLEIGFKSNLFKTG